MAYNLKAVLEAEVIDKLLTVMKAEDQSLEAKIAKLGTNVGSAGTYAELPTVDHNGKAVGLGDVVTLTTTDGTHPAGKYERKPDNSGWEDQPFINFDALNISSIIADAKAEATAMTVDSATAVISATEDGKFATPKQVAEAMMALQSANNTLNDGKYHPKGGDVALKVVGKDADENTQEFVTANQLKATFTVAEVQAKYDAL